MRLFAATRATDTNTFSPLPTNLASCKETVFLRPGEHPNGAPRRAAEVGSPLRRDDRRIPYAKVDRPTWPLDQEAKLGLIV